MKTDGCEDKNTSVNEFFKFIFSPFFQNHQTAFINTGVEDRMHDKDAVSQNLTGQNATEYAHSYGYLPVIAQYDELGLLYVFRRAN